MKCASCGGPFHPATGDWDRRYQVARCGTCMRSFVKWLKGMLGRRWSGQLFYEAAATSIKGDRP